MPTYTFPIILNGHGSNAEEAWNNATEGFISDPGLPGDDNYTVEEFDEDDEPFECQNCDWEGVYEDGEPAKDLTKRHEPGDTYSDRECPRCGALILPKTEVST